MARIKVVGYLDTEDLPKSWLDNLEKSGLSEEGFEFAIGALISGPLGLMDIDIEAE